MTVFWQNFKNYIKDLFNDSIPYKTKGHHAFTHWWHQRLSAIFIILLILLLGEFFVNILKIFSLPLIIKLSQQTATSCLLTLLIIAIFYHAALGMQVIIEDYIKSNKMKRILILLLKTYSYITIITFLLVIIRYSYST